MNFRFDPDYGLVLVKARLTGPVGSRVVNLALDTGATDTTIGSGMLVSIGYDPAVTAERTMVTTGSGVEFAPRVIVARLPALGHEWTEFPIICHTLPPSAGVDGLLGLDFLRGLSLTVDFRTGWISLG